MEKTLPTPETFRVTAADRSRLQFIARRAGVSKSEVIRRLIGAEAALILGSGDTGRSGGGRPAVPPDDKRR